jgi:hypothetical protein
MLPIRLLKKLSQLCRKIPKSIKGLIRGILNLEKQNGQLILQGCILPEGFLEAR